MSGETAKTKDRSPNFPFITLEVALERAQVFYGMEKRGAAPYKAAASHWHYSALSSGGMQTVAALKSYGLMSDDGSGEKRTVRLTDLAFRILLDQRPDSQERAGYLREAALMPSVANDVYAKWDGRLPSEATLLHYLVLDRAFNDSNAHKVVKILFKNHVFAALDSSGVLLETTEPEEDMHVVAPMPTSQQSARAMPLTAQRPAAAAAVAVQPNLSKEERVIAPDSDVLIQFTGDPTWATYDFLESYAKLRKSVLKQKDTKTTAETKEGD